MADPAGPDAGKEWLELYNRGQTKAPLEGTALQINDGRLMRLHTTDGVPPDGYYTLGNGNDVSHSMAALELPNKAGRLRLHCGERTLADVSYGGDSDVLAPRSGVSLSFDIHRPPANALVQGSAAAWCFAKGAPYDGENVGTPGAANAGCAAMCLENGVLRAPREPQPGELDFSEIMADPAGPDANHEWIELHATGALDLAGLRVEQELPQGRKRTWNLASDACMAVREPGFVVLAVVKNAGDFVGQAAPQHELMGPQVYNSASVWRLFVGDSLLDSVDAPKARSGASYGLYGATWCVSQAATPGAPQTACAAP